MLLKKKVNHCEKSSSSFELPVNGLHPDCEQSYPAHGQGKAHFTLPMGRVKHTLPL